MIKCPDCFDARAVPGVFGDYVACPSCVIDAGHTFVIFERDSGSDEPSVALT